MHLHAAAIAPTEDVLTAESASKSIPTHEKIKLWTRAGGRCEICNKYLLEDEFTAQPVSLAELAHNVGRQKAAGSPRGLADLPIEERNKAENLLLLCGDHHRVIDASVTRGDYTVEGLFELKRGHEDRIRYLTELGEDSETVVVRAVGAIRDAPVELSRETVRRAVATSSRYPRYDLTMRGGDIELDLRMLPDEASSEYWREAERQVAGLVTRIRDGVTEGVIRHISLFAFGRIPLLVYIGSKLDDKIPTDLYQKQRGGNEDWHWDAAAPAVAFETVTTRAGAADTVALVISVTGTVDVSRLPESTSSSTIYTLRPTAEITPSPDIFRNRGSLENFAAAYRAFLAQFEIDHPGVSAVDIFPAVPITGAVVLGRARMADVHPHLRVHDRDGDGGYSLALEVT